MTSLIIFSQELLDAHDAFEANMSAAEEEYKNIMALVSEMNALGCTDNPYTTLTPDVCTLVL
jgi:hypothetical protein